MIKSWICRCCIKRVDGWFKLFKNLLFALDSLENKEIEVFIFVGKQTDVRIKIMFKQYATVIEDNMFDRKSLKWFLMKIEQKILRYKFLSF